ncbi:transglycosylase domain-containing protein [Rhizobium halophytocola]|uniref:peptidoglycan glycosyltransferase n=1 Tax=Rhizobium halophytocola TaxID=735519 RepID=A0ABS4E166_9HYPH|nr:transglycosylase domain-containing protein [Rhizobium halophytocola]MBP1851675.1 penicillin-binding protein 1A [Rhizobium halophytocola]
MAGRHKSRQRIEPTLGGRSDNSRDDDDLRLDSRDRVRGQDTGEGRKPRRSGKTSGKSKRSKKDRGGSRGGLFGLVRRLFYWGIVLGIWGGIAVACLIGYYAAQMPSASSWTIPARPPNLKIVASDGTVLANRGLTGGEAVGLDEMSPYIPEAVIAIEDRRFYSHFGVDPLGLARAVVNNLTGRSIQGGSTLTQQLAKNLFLSPDRTLERKIQEVMLAFWLEHKFSKDQILAMYLNRVYFGANSYGVEAASHRYFNKSARDVTLGEAAILAGLLKAPSRLSPAHDPDAAKARAQVVLGAMKETGFITEDQVKTAMSQPASKSKSYFSGAGQYVADMVTAEAKSILGPLKQDVVVETTIDPAWEKEAEQAIQHVLDKNGAKYNASQGALVSVDGTGAIRALVGGRDYATSQFNRAIKAKRQPGSAFKPFVYTAAMEIGDTPDSIRNDAPVKIGNWTPENYEKTYSGPVTLAHALAESLNTVAAQLVQEVGPPQVIKIAHRLGIESDLQPNASIALGTSEVSLLELTSAYAPFMNGGFKATPHIISRITSVSGDVLYQSDYGNPPRVLSDQVVSEMNSMLMGVVRDGTGKKAAVKGWQTAGKTGTTQNSRDALFVGYTSQLTTGVWLGNDDGKPMKHVTGGTLPATAWHDFMTAAHKGLTPSPLGEDYSQPAQAPDDTISVSKVLKEIFGSSDPSTAYPPAPTSQAPPALTPQQQEQQQMQQTQPQPAQDGSDPFAQPSNGQAYPNDPYQQAPADPLPPGSIGGGPVPPGSVGADGQPQKPQPHRSTLLDVLMGQ